MNIRTKKFIIVIFVFMISLGLVACQKDNDNTKDSSTYLISFDTDGGNESEQIELKEVYTLVMHLEKELNYMTEYNGSVVVRFRGDKDDYFSIPVSHMYNLEPFSYVSQLTFDARLFGSKT